MVGKLCYLIQCNRSCCIITLWLEYVTSLLANMIIPLKFDAMFESRSISKTLHLGTTWAPTSYKWSANPYKWICKLVSRVITPLLGVETPVIEDRCPPCMISILNFRGACVWTMPFPPVFLRLKGPGSLICSCVFWWNWGGVGEVSQNQRSAFFGGNSSWKTKPRVRKKKKTHPLSKIHPECSWSIHWNMLYIQSLKHEVWNSLWFSGFPGGCRMNDVYCFSSFKMNRLNWHYWSKFDAFLN